MVLIDINLPKATDEMVEITIFGDGKVLQTGESWRSPESGKCYYTTTTPEKHFQAVELPPHGDLIDRDALLKKCEFVCTDDDEDIRAVRYNIIENAPTIIPAEESKEETCTKDL